MIFLSYRSFMLYWFLGRIRNKSYHIPKCVTNKRIFSLFIPSTFSLSLSFSPPLSFSPLLTLFHSPIICLYVSMCLSIYFFSVYHFPSLFLYHLRPLTVPIASLFLSPFISLCHSLSITGDYFLIWWTSDILTSFSRVAFWKNKKHLIRKLYKFQYLYIRCVWGR